VPIVKIDNMSDAFATKVCAALAGVGTDQQLLHAERYADFLLL
jgi:hypothetical protein